MTTNTVVTLANNPAYVRQQIAINRARQEQALERLDWRDAALYEAQADYWQDRLEELETVETGDLGVAA